MSTGALAEESSPLPETPFPLGTPIRGSQLPAAITPLVGREQDIEYLAAMLQGDTVRLVTLTGLGGIGKTRLAIETVRQIAGDFAEGTAFVALAAVQDPQLVASTIAQTLELQGDSGHPVSMQLQAALRDHELLLLLDNFEHLMPAATLVSDLLTACPRLKILITSRFKLRLTGEHELTVTPLETADPARLPGVIDLGDVPAIRLFVERAQAANPSFLLSSANAGEIAKICRQLDGIPLALELAAAWTNRLSPQAILARLERRLILLTGGPKDAPDRLQSMRAAITGSYELLDPSSQMLLQQISVFTGGCTIEAAEAVCVLPDGCAVLDGVTDLLEKGFLQPAANANGEPRFALLETIREFGQEQLNLSGVYEPVSERHTAWFQRFAEIVQPGLEGPDSHVWLRRVDADIDNIRMALSRLKNQGRIEDALRMASALAWAWAPNYLVEACTWFDELLELADDAISQSVVAKAISAQAGIFDWQGRFSDSARLHERALANFRELEDDWFTAHSLRGLGYASLSVGELDRAEALLDEARMLAIQVNDQWNIAACINSLGRVAGVRGDWSRAIAWHEEALSLWRGRDDTTYVVTALTELAWAHLQVAEHRRAWEAYETALSLALETNNRYEIAFSLIGFAWLAGEYGQHDVAARLFTFSTNMLDLIKIPIWPQDPALVTRKIDEVRSALGSSAYFEHATIGRAMKLDEATALALTVVVPDEVTDNESGLTPRELEVLQLVVDGASDNEIADRLFITRRTASKHVAAIIEKLGVPNRTAAATAAVRRGLI